MSTAVKRTYPEAACTRPHKIHRTTNPNNLAEIRPNELWETICKTELQTLREMVYHATLSNIDPQISVQMLNMHRVRLHNESVQAEQARKAQEIREKRDRKKIIDFDHHFRQIDFWVQNAPIDRKVCRVSYGVYEKIMARIAKIEQKAIEDTTNFQSRCNALETLRKVVDTIIFHESGAMGIEIYTYTNTDCSIENVMLNILDCMTRSELEELLTVRHDGALWIESMEELDAFRKTKKVYFGDERGTAPFKGISNVLECVYEHIKQEAVESVEVKRESTGDDVEVKKEGVDVEVKREGGDVEVKRESTEG